MGTWYGERRKDSDGFSLSELGLGCLFAPPWELVCLFVGSLGEELVLGGVGVIDGRDLKRQISKKIFST